MAATTRTSTKGPRTHAQVLVHHGAMRAEVDAGIADVIRETWRAGITTEESCQGRFEVHAGCKCAFVCFPAGDAERWLKIVNPDVELPKEYETEDPKVQLPPLSTEQEKGLERRRLRTGFSGPKRRRWEFVLLPYDPIDVSVHFSVLIYFPASDVDDVLSLLRAHNERSEARS